MRRTGARRARTLARARWASAARARRFPLVVSALAVSLLVSGGSLPVQAAATTAARIGPVECLTGPAVRVTLPGSDTGSDTVQVVVNGATVAAPRGGAGTFVVDLRHSPAPYAIQVRRRGAGGTGRHGVLAHAVLPGCSYVALGDSYAAGEALPPFDPGPDPGTSNACHRSAAAWPRLLAGSDPRWRDLGHVACSGASLSSLTRSALHGEAPQLSRLRSYGGSPRLVTVMIGGNDAAFGPVLGTCFLTDCLATPVVSTTGRLVDSAAFAGAMAAAFRQVRAAAPRARVVVVGYPNLFNPDSAQASRRCRWLSTGENDALLALNARLDAVSARAAAAAGVEYDSTMAVLRGHELCTSTPFLVPVGFTTHPARYSAHPTALGQRQLAGEVARFLRGG